MDLAEVDFQTFGCRIASEKQFVAGSGIAYDALGCTDRAVVVHVSEWVPRKAGVADGDSGRPYVDWVRQIYLRADWSTWVDHLEFLG